MAHDTKVCASSRLHTQQCVYAWENETLYLSFSGDVSEADKNAAYFDSYNHFVFDVYIIVRLRIEFFSKNV